MPSDADLSLLPPMLRLAAMSKATSNSSTSSTSTTTGTTRDRMPTIRIPVQNKSFAKRKEQMDALQKIRCAPRTDMMTEDEKRKQTLLRRQTNKARMANERMNHGNMDMEPESLSTPTSSVQVPALQKSTTHTWTSSTSTADDDDTISRRSEYHTNSKDSSTVLVVKDTRPPHNVTTTTTTTGTTSTAATTTGKHSRDILQKKLDKVNKLLGKEVPGSKEYNKLARKQEQYQMELDEAMAIPSLDVEPTDEERMTTTTQSYSSSPWKQRQEQQEEEGGISSSGTWNNESSATPSQMEVEARMLKERAEALKAKRGLTNSETMTICSPRPVSSRSLSPQKKSNVSVPDTSATTMDRVPYLDPESEDEDGTPYRAVVQEDDDDEEELHHSSLRSSPSNVVPVTDDEEEEDDNHHDDHHRHEEEDAKNNNNDNDEEDDEERIRLKQEREKEFRILKKKLTKLDGMISDAENTGKDTTKLLKKMEEYISQLEEFEEWEEERVIRSQVQEQARQRKEREDAEKKRKQDLEADRRRRAEEEQLLRRQKAQEEAKRRRKAHEEVQRLRKAAEEADRQRRADQETERRKRAEEEAERRRKAKEEVERRRKAKEEAEELREAERRAEADRRREQRRLEEEEEVRREQRRLEEAEERRREQQSRIELEREQEEEERRRQEQQEEEEERMRLQAKEEERKRQQQEREEMEYRLQQQQQREEEDRLRLQREREEEEEKERVRGREIEARRAEERAAAEQRREDENRHLQQHVDVVQDEAKNSHEEVQYGEQSRSVETETVSKTDPALDAASSHDFIDIRNIPEPHSYNTKTILKELGTLQGHQQRLEKTLKQNGIAISEDIPYEVAKDKIAQLQEQMQTLSNSGEDQRVVQKKYYTLEEELSKYFTALMLTDEFAEEQRMAEANWEDSIEAENITALRKVRSHMPVNIRNMTEEELTTTVTPNGKTLPKAVAVKFKRSNVLQLIRVNPLDLERMHPSLIEGLRSTGLTLTERRALHEHLKDVGAKWQELQQDPSIERKYSWFLSLKSKFKEMVSMHERQMKGPGPPGNAKRSDPYDEDYGYTQEAEFEGGMPAPPKAVAKSKSTSFSSTTKKKDDLLMASIRERLQLTPEESAIDRKLLRELFFAEKRTGTLEKQLAQNGIALPKEDISYAVAKAKVTEITEEIKVVVGKMGETSDMKLMMELEKEYASLSDDLEKYNNALMLTKEWGQELLEKERQWEENVRPANQEALRKIRRHMPVNIKDLSENDMIEGVTPNGKQLPQKIVRKFKRTNILQLLRMPPNMIEPMHPSSLESMRSTGLTLTERRALHEHLKDLGAKWKAGSNDKMAERKWMWHESLRGKFKELVGKFEQGFLKINEADDYNDDYGFPSEDVYLVEKVKKSNLLTVEELERRKQDDGWGYDTPVVAEEEATQGSTTGLMTAIAGRGVVRNETPKSEEGTSNRAAPAGLLSAIQSKANRGDQNDGTAPKAPAGLLSAIQSKANKGDQNDGTAPKAPSGLLSAIQSRASKVDQNDVSGGSASKAPAGLLSAIQSRGNENQKNDSDGTAPTAPAGLLSAIQSKASQSKPTDKGDARTDSTSLSPTKRKRLGGLLAAIRGRK